ncbi:phosphate ABC transporter ATP-binding protein [Candidatus Bathyarchaeota archaeon]|nr:phosphate ABC transporter ATP-binding protein [Candidatus Bathyarchaeota archaeon]
MNSLEIINLNVYYGNRHVIKGINLKIPQKVVFAIIGPSGSGKSTLLRAINRLIELDEDAKVEGDVRLFKKSIYEMDPREVRRRIGMVFQQPNPFPHMSIYDNVALGPRLNKLVRNKEELDYLVEWALKKAALWDEVKDRLGDLASKLSGGQQQRLCIARALALKPDVLLLDEPTSALDPVSTAKIENLLLELKKSYTVVIVTHRIQQAARIGDYTAFLLDGKLVEVGDTAQIFVNPKDRRTEAYITGRFG